ncbi:MAG: PIN domain-containing protein [Phormidium sp. GEM2.Bin31]|nr:type II toxin-antitoxin system VapC family toxin [Phormidium sp. BM_Day4_Bin.17]TVR09778.1 MAG: PIN domain-containing protein [Phormidium sp. GEM2.Bin31]UCJ11743.1 MAG: type II toxin-antitoxin system VapC family toxin [Phormidium sp. PBR-2020]
MAKFVIDANVAIKWVLPEIYSDRALSLLDNDHDELLVPDFFFSEITNILWKRTQRGELTLEAADKKLSEIKQVDFAVFDSLDLVSQALATAVQVKQAVYDCVYLTLAIEHCCQMVTADERFINALRQGSSIDCVVWLGAVGEGGG